MVPDTGIFAPDRYFNHSVLPTLEKAICLPDPAQWKTVRNERRGVDLTLFDQAQNLGAVAAVHAAGSKGEILAVHIR